MRIYCCKPISGASADEVFGYYEGMEALLGRMGYEVETPMHGKDVLRCEKEFRAQGYGSPLSTNHAIYNRDRWMVRRADVVYANLCGASRVSIGSVMEMAVASELGKHVVLAVESGNVHEHAFVLEAADVVYGTHEEAVGYLGRLAGRLARG